MKKFRIKLPVLSVVLIAICVVLDLYILVRGVLLFARGYTSSAVDAACNVILWILLVFLVVLGVAVPAYSVYEIKGDYFVTRLGMIYFSRPLAEIGTLIYYKTREKLVMYFKDSDKYRIILLSVSRHEAFIAALREKDPQILYEVKADEID